MENTFEIVWGFAMQIESSLSFRSQKRHVFDQRNSAELHDRFSFAEKWFQS